MAKVISIANPKGGVTKSTTCFNLAYILGAVKKKKVLVIDLDPQRSVSKLCDAFAGYKGDTASNMMQDNPINPSKMAVRVFENVDMVFGGNDLKVREDWLKSAGFGELKFKRLFENDQGLKGYDYVLIDTAGDSGIIPLACLVASDEVLVPVKPEYVSIVEVVSVFDRIKELNENIRPAFGMDALKLNKLVFTVVEDAATSMSDNYQFGLEKAQDYGFEVAESYISKSVRMDQALKVGKSIVEFDSKHKLSNQYLNLVQELYGV